MALNTTLSSFTTSQVVTAADLNALVDALNDAQAAWTTYAPAMTGSGSNPANYTTTNSAFTRIGKLIHFRACIQAAGGFTIGSGNYSVGLPVTPAASSRRITWSGTYFDTSANKSYPMLPRLVSGAAWMAISDSVGVGSSSPVTPAAGDEWVVNGVYEAD